MKRIIVLSIILVLGGWPTGAEPAKAQIPPADCAVFDYKCKENQRTNCDAWDYLCKEDPNDCPAWDSSCRQASPSVQSNNSTRQTIQYTKKVSCDLVLEEMFGGVSGYCKESPGANLNHCIINKVTFLDPYSVEFLCADGRPGLMDIPSRNEVKLKNLGSAISFGDPYWIICDEGMGSFKTNKRCYDSEFSDRDDWDVLCEVDKRLNRVYDYPNTYVWFVCS